MAAALAHLAALDEPGALYDGYAADAPVCFGFEVRPKAYYPRAEFIALQEAAERLHRRDHGRPRQPDPGELTPLQTSLAGVQALTWLAGSRWLVGVGLVLERGSWKVRWSTLAPPGHAPGWSFEQGQLQAVAELGVVRAAGLWGLRSWLDAAHQRLFARATPPLVTLPGARFGCGSSTDCCTVGYTIPAPAGAQAVVDALEAAGIGPSGRAPLALMADGALLLKPRDEDCRYLDAERQCVVHKSLGRQPFPVCAAYPLRFSATPDGVAVTGSAGCPSVRGNQGPLLTERAEDLYGRLAMQQLSPAPERFRLGAGQEVGWAGFREAEAALLKALERTDLALVDRLYLGLQGLHERLGLPIGPHREVAAEADRAVLRGFLRSFDHGIGLAGPAEAPALKAVRELPQEAELLALLRNTLFDKRYAFEHDLLTAWHVAIFAALLFMHLQSYEGLLARRRIWRLASLLQHRSVFQTLAHGLAGAFAKPGFGVELLGVVEVA